MAKSTYILLVFSIFMSITAEGRGQQPTTFLTDQFWYHQNKSAMANVSQRRELPGITSFPNELWKPIPDYDGKYYVSNRSRIASHYVRRTKTFTYVIMKSYLSTPGYYAVGLSKYGQRKKVNGKTPPSKTKYVHRLVGKLWVSGYRDGLCIDHKNGVKTDNTLSNLEWVTGRENVRRAFNEQGLVDRKGENHFLSKFTRKEVIWAREQASLGFSHPSIHKSINKSTRRNLTDAINGVTWGWLKPTLLDFKNERA